ncbi:MAG TPA: nuclear transport factor 2 family protein [Ktedonosporobacter sp.]|jgi:limonene-1,2-epoxide hydrolase|nr:nuclear transport factor 2 family protein [Ktedonosporobacter sp.]
MSEQENLQIIRNLWKAFDDQNFDAAGELLHRNYVGYWPQTGERIRGRENFVIINKHYPEQWQVTILRLIAAGDQVISEVKLTYQDEIVYAISFFELQDGKILKETDYWPEPYEPPTWRSQWTETS